MKINLGWLQDYVSWQIPEAELLERINRRLGEIEAVTEIGQNLQSAVIVRVVTASQLPGTNLQVVELDDRNSQPDLPRNKQGLVTVVCGAANVRAGMLSVWLPPGSQLPNQPKTILKARSFKGLTSQGMLASAQELGLGGNDKDIVDLESVADQDQLVGQSLTKGLPLQTTVIDIDNKMFTHRPDCFGLLGIAREVAVIADGQLKIPSWYDPKVSFAGQPPTDWELKVDCQELVPYFTASLITGVTVAASNLVRQVRLASVDLPAINNVVDATNEIMYLTGQPTHAFDADKLRQLNQGPKLVLCARLATPGESLELLSGKTITLDKPKTIVIATNHQPVALAGVMGGLVSQVTAETKNVLLEAANFDMYAVRRTCLNYGLVSQAATRFTKGQSPRQLPVVARRLADLVAVAGQAIQTATEGQVADLSPVTVSPDFIHSRLGNNRQGVKRDTDYLKKNVFEAGLPG